MALHGRDRRTGRPAAAGRPGILALLAPLAVLILVILAGVAPARAHAVLVQADPADGAVLPAMPEVLSLRFSEAVQIHALRLSGSDGTSAALTPEAGDRGAGAASGLVLLRPPAAGPGSFVLSWRIGSADGHPVAGSLVFTVGAADAGFLEAARAGDSSGAARALHAVLRGLAYAAGLPAAGVVLFLALFGADPAAEPPGLRRLAGFLAVLGGAAVLGASAVEGVLLGTGPVPAGAAPLLRLGGLATAAVAAAWRPATPACGPAAALALALSYAVTGHSSVLGSAWLSALLALHVFAAAFWIGSFPALILAARHADGAALRRLAGAFAGVATILVPLLAAAGLTLAWALVGSWQALLGTAYGRLLAGKALLVAAMLGLAGLNRWRLVPALPDGGPDAAARLRRAILAEAAAGLAVLAVTAALTSTHPPAHAGAGGVLAVLHPGLRLEGRAGPLSLVLSTATSLPGPNRFELEIRGADGAPREVRAVTLRLASPAAGIEGIARAMARVMDGAGPGRWSHAGAETALPGTWRIEAEVLVDDFERRSATFELRLGHGGHGH
ncbi:copper resistance CopC/CopD family protein [Arenibaculum pallidiluteum]|uniref:copper resistance CopC/CopD family protein n=1 Tax=Arenibaculum pallidiluteum TaxID=2812559 RepID=UPI001A9668FF|nr:CopD family protein [Arenibaculum pallidiluteum]